MRDSDDQCPSDPAGAHPDRNRAGCPDPDRDHDGVANEIDRCSDEPETINGVTDDDGCADAGDENVTFAGNALILRNALRLRARARALSAAEQTLLAQVAQRIRSRGADVTGVTVRVVPAAGVAAGADAARLAGLVADSIATHGVSRASINAIAATPERGATVGEVRIVVEARRAARPSSSASPASAAPSASPAPSAAPASSASPAPSAAPAR